MGGFILGWIFVGLALLLLGRAFLLRRRDRALMARLVAVAARVTDQGIHPQVSRLVAGREDTDYVGTYQYVVGGKTHDGVAASSSSPVFRKDQMPPRQITVYYDQADPSVSRRSATMPDDTPRAFMIFGVIVLAVGIAAMVIPNLYWIADRVAPGFFDDGD